MGIKFVKKTIGDCFDLINGYAFKSNEFISSGNPVIKIKNIKAGYFSEHEFSYVDDNFLITKTEKIVQESDLLISMTGNRHDGTPETWVGKIALFPYKKINNFFLNQRVGALRVKDNAKINPIYASYVLSSWEYQQWFIAIATSSGGQANLSPKQILETEFEFPDKNIQDLIANILSSFDKKITLNRQINQTLEQMAQTLFKSWFVDFDPVIDNALDAGNDIPDTLQERAEQRRLLRAKADFKPLPAETRALFPSEFEETELGWVPKGWNVKKLGELVTVKRGGSPRPIQDFLVSDGFPWVKISDATASDSRFLSTTKEFIKPEGLNKTVLLKKGELILSNSATPGLPKFLELDACIHDGWLYFPEKTHFSDLYLYQLFLEIRSLLVQQGNGSVFTNLKTDILKQHSMVVPTLNVLSVYENQVQQFHTKIQQVTKETQSLQNIRDILLPKLISGELALDALPEAPELAEAR